MDAQDYPVAHFEFLAKLGEALKKRSAQILAHDYSYESFGSWTLVLRYEGRAGRVVYDGREGRMTLQWSPDRKPPYEFRWAYWVIYIAGRSKMDDEVITAICDTISNGGLDARVRAWEGTAAAIAEARPAWVNYDEFLNDMDGRGILRQWVELAGPTERALYDQRIADADALFRANIVMTQLCIWGEENAAEYGYSPDVDWYYYRRPKTIDSSWPARFRDS